MSDKGFQGLKQQAQGEAQDAANALGKSAQQVVNQATDAGQKAVLDPGYRTDKVEEVVSSIGPTSVAIDHACKTAQDGVEKATGQATEAVSGLGKKYGLKK